MSDSLSNNRELWQQRAAEARAIAQLMNDPMARERMLEIAAAYDKLALKSEDRR